MILGETLNNDLIRLSPPTFRRSPPDLVLMAYGHDQIAFARIGAELRETSPPPTTQPRILGSIVSVELHSFGPSVMYVCKSHRVPLILRGCRLRASSGVTSCFLPKPRLPHFPSNPPLRHRINRHSVFQPQDERTAQQTGKRATSPQIHYLSYRRHVEPNRVKLPRIVTRKRPAAPP